MELYNLLLLGCTSQDVPSENFTVTSLSDKGFVQVYTFRDINPSSPTHDTFYSFTSVQQEHPYSSLNTVRSLHFDNLSKPVLFHFLEPWCFPCMEELPNLERLAEEENVSIFGITSDYYKIPSVNGIPIENTVTFPLFYVEQDDEQYKAFLHALNPSSLAAEESDTPPEQFVATVEMLNVFPRSLFVYNSNNMCFFPGAQTYDLYVEQTNQAAPCPEFVLTKIK